MPRCTSEGTSAAHNRHSINPTSPIPLAHASHHLFKNNIADASQSYYFTAKTDVLG